MDMELSHNSCAMVGESSGTTVSLKEAQIVSPVVTNCRLIARKFGSPVLLASFLAFGPLSGCSTSSKGRSLISDRTNGLLENFEDKQDEVPAGISKSAAILFQSFTGLFPVTEEGGQHLINSEGQRVSADFEGLSLIVYGGENQWRVVMIGLRAGKYRVLIDSSGSGKVEAASELYDSIEYNEGVMQLVGGRSGKLYVLNPETGLAVHSDGYVGFIVVDHKLFGWHPGVLDEITFRDPLLSYPDHIRRPPEEQQPWRQGAYLEMVSL